MPQTTSLSSVAAAVPNSDGTRVKASRSSLMMTWRVMPMILPQVSTRYRSFPSPMVSRLNSPDSFTFSSCGASPS